VVSKEDVCCLDVAVQDLAVVGMLDCAGELYEPRPDLILGEVGRGAPPFPEFCFGDALLQVSSRAQFGDEHQVLRVSTGLERVLDEPNDVWMAHTLQKKRLLRLATAQWCDKCIDPRSAQTQTRFCLDN